MARRPDIFLPLEANGQLRLDAPTGRSLDLVADGQTLRLDIPGLQELRTMSMPFQSRARTVRVVAAVLASHGLTLVMESAGKSVLLVGSSVRPNWLARLLGLAPARIPLAAITALLGRHVIRSLRRQPAPR